MYVKALVSFLAISLVAASAHAQPAAVPQPGAPTGPMGPGAAMMGGVPDVGGMLSSFFSSAARPTTEEKTEVHIQRAQTAYNDKKYKDAMTSLQLAQDALRRQHAEYYVNLFPKATANWALDPVKPEDTICLGQQIFGGLLVQSRTYTSNGNKVHVAFLTDAPVMSFIVPILQAAAPFIAQGELAQGTVKGYPSIYLENKDGGPLPVRPMQGGGMEGVKSQPMHVLLVLMGDVIVGISSETLGREYLNQFANILDYEKLKSGQ